MSPEHASPGRVAGPSHGELAGWRVAGAVGEKQEFSAVWWVPEPTGGEDVGTLSGDAELGHERSNVRVPGS